MRLLIALAALVAAADLVLMTPVRVHLRFSGGKPSVTAEIGPMRLWPRKKARRQGTGRRKSLLRRVPPRVLCAGVRRGLSAAARLLRRTRLTAVRVRFTAGGDDPYRAAMAYGRAGLALEGIGRLWADSAADADLRAEMAPGGRTQLDAEVRAAARLGTVAWAAAGFSFAVLREYYCYKKNGRMTQIWQNERWAS